MMARAATPDILAATMAGDSQAFEAAMGPQAQRVATVHIRLDGGTQPRAGIDQAVVDDYHSDMQAGAVFPPVELVYDGTDYWLWDGFHRFQAWRKDGDRAILANVRQGTRRDAVLLSVGANATHGFRRTSEDKRRAVETLLRDEEWVMWSDREIARRCAVDGKTVAARRAALSAEIPQIGEERRAVRNGTAYTVSTPKRQPAPAVASQGGKQKPQPAPDPYDPMELVEELVALESVALDGVDEAWLFEYMEGIAKRNNRSFDRRTFNAALRDAVRRQIADNERRQRLETARKAAMTADQEHQLDKPSTHGRAAAFVPADIEDQVEVEAPMLAWPSTNGRAALPSEQMVVVDWRRTRGQITEDGRVLVQMSDGTKNPPWLELDDAGQHWMVDMIQRAQEGR